MRTRTLLPTLLGLLIVAVFPGCASGSASGSGSTSAAPQERGTVQPTVASTASPGALASWQDHSIDPKEDPAVIVVTGIGRVEVDPDRARISFAVETEAASAREAAEANARRMEAVMAAVRSEAGSRPGFRMETSGYTLVPRYRSTRDGQGREIEGYTARNSVQVTVDAVDAVGGIMDAALRSGANRMSGLNFLVRDPVPHRHRALEEATASARAEAEVTAAALGMRVGDPIEVQIQGDYSVVAARSVSMEMAMSDAPSTPVEAGAQSIMATVTFRFRLLPRDR